MNNLQISIVIPVYNESENILPLAEWIDRSLENFKYEVIFVDDGSTDSTWQKIKEARQKIGSHIRGVRLLRNYGKSAALSVGFRRASAPVIVTMDGDLQDSPEEIVALYRMVVEEGYDLVSGWKRQRQDPLSRRLPSKLFNFTVRLLTGIPLHDFNCGLKAYRAEVARRLSPQGEMHRYLPVIAYQLGYRRIAEKPVRHYPRRHGKSKFGAERFVRGFLDLLTVLFITRFGRRPMHLFGFLGLVCFLVGFGIAVYLSYIKLVLGVVRIAERPLFYLGLLAMIIGSQLFLTGFLAELVVRVRSHESDYIIAESAGIADS